MAKSRLVEALDRHVFPRINDWILGDRVSALRDDVIGVARGRILEIGAGTGLNFARYREGEVVAIEPNPGMREKALAAAREAMRNNARLDIRLIDGKCEALPLDAESFDSVISTFVLCSVRDLDASLREIARVLRPDGKFSFVEHGASDDPREASWQIRVKPMWRNVFGGCDPTRDISAALQHRGFDVAHVSRISLPLPFLARPGFTGRVTR